MFWTKIIAFDIIATSRYFKIKKIVFSNDLTSGTTWQIVMALLLKSEFQQRIINLI
jgi:hypothetical protein